MTETPLQEGGLILARHDIPAEAPPIRVNPVDPEMAQTQPIVDADVLASHQEWVDAGRPQLFNRGPRKLYVVKEADMKRTTQMLTNAARLYPGVRIKVIKPIQVDAEGNAWVYWVAKERQHRPGSQASRAAAQAPPPAPPQPVPAAGPRFIPPSPP